MPRSNQTLIASRYRILRLLGEGGFGAVYLAQDNRLGNKQVALKESFDRSAEALDQFRLEAQILANLQHSNLPRVTDTFIEPDGCQFLVMDFIEGADLDHQIKTTNRPLPEAEAVRILCQVSEAVAYLHTRRPQPIIHRDIKLSNIKLTASGQAILVDFGIAKIYHPKKGTAKVAKAVSPHFSSPEQYVSKTDARSDVYSLGATLYCLVTAHLPQDGMERLLNDQLVAPTRYDPSLSPMLENIILKAMRLDPNLRYSNANQFLAALRGYRGGIAQPAQANQPAMAACPHCGNPTSPTARFCRRCGKALTITPPRQTPILQPPPVDPQLNFEIANLLLQKDEYQQALPRYLECLQSGFTHPAVYVNLALCYLALHRSTDALRVIDDGIRSHPNHLELLHEKALVCKIAGNQPEALRCARLLCQKDATKCSYAVLYGQLLMDSDQMDEAIRQLTHAVRLDASDFDAQSLLGQAYGRDGNLRQAASELNKAIKLDPQRPEPHMWLGIFHLEADKFSQAIKHFENALKVQKTLHIAHYYIGKAYLNMKEPRQAYAHFKTAVAMDDQDPDYFVAQALAAALMKDTNEARALVRRALALNPNHQDAIQLSNRL